MKIIHHLRTWYQAKTGEEETPFDGDAPAWVVSLFFHLIVLAVVATLSLVATAPKPAITLIFPEEEPEETITLPEVFTINDLPQDEIGTSNDEGTDPAQSEAPILAEPVVTTPELVNLEVEAPFAETAAYVLPTGILSNERLAVPGTTGAGVTGAVGAIDRITNEILLSLEERKTLVVWMFDQSGSLALQREEILERFDRVYDELGVIEASGNPAFTRHEDKPLLTSIVAFGEQISLLTEEPTDDLAEIKSIVQNIVQDDSGVENVFQAVYQTADAFRYFRTPSTSTEAVVRNVMIVAFTDEAGDDTTGLDPTVELCVRYEIPVYVVGIPAPFGRRETLVKWVDRDFEGSQSPQWGAVNQGPESLALERLKLDFADNLGEAPIDSGYGPFALTRLCYATSGGYFAVHPNRNLSRAINRNETAAFSAHIQYFFDENVMRRYRPDYVSRDEYARRLAQNRCRAALVNAAGQSWLSPMEDPELDFIKRDEASFANLLTEAQHQAARLQPKIELLHQILSQGSADREEETIARWQAGYDLAIGRVLAYKVRTIGYNFMLASAKQGDLPDENANSNTYHLEPNDAITTGSQLERLAEDARNYLQRVVNDHPGTPWAMLAERELAIPLGWKWTESYTDLAPPREGGGGGNGNNNNGEPPRVRPRPVPARVPRL